MSTTTFHTSKRHVDALHDELARRGLSFPDETLDLAILYGIERLAAKNDEPYRYDFEFNDLVWDEMLDAVLEYLEVDYDVYAGL